MERKEAAINFKLDIYAESVDKRVVAAIVKAAALADLENMPESVLEDAKIAEARNKTARMYATIEHNKGVEKGAIKKEKEAVIYFYENGVPIPVIAKSLHITEQRVVEILNNP